MPKGISGQGYLAKEAEEGDAQSREQSGALRPGQGVEPDAGRALHWFAQSAKAGHPSGMSNYGRMLEQGRGIAANPREAARWFDLAARQGCQPEAQYNLGLLYERGRGVPQDDKAAAAACAWPTLRPSSKANPGTPGAFLPARAGAWQKIPAGPCSCSTAAANGEAGAIRELEEMAKEGPARPAAVLFGQKLDAADRAAMRAALKIRHARQPRERRLYL